MRKNSITEKLDEEKASLTELKFENQKLRKNLEKAENESLEIVTKLAELTQKNADLQHEVKNNNNNSIL